MKNFLISMMSLALCFCSFIRPVFAADEVKETPQEFILGFESDNLQDRETFYGNGGSSKLNYANSGRTLTWSLHPDNGEALNFNGTITISLASNGTIKQTHHITGFGVNVSGTVSVGNLKSGTRYRADLTGVAIGVFSGNKYTIIDNAHITFTYNSYS